MQESDQTTSMPETVWDETDYTLIHVAILFADLGRSMTISSAMPPKEYEHLINSLHKTLLGLVEELKQQGVPIGEVHTAGDELGVFFYEPEEVEDNFSLDSPAEIADNVRKELISKCLERNNQLVFAALQTAINLKNRWLIQPLNIKRVKEHRDPWDIGIGIHYGWVYLCNRADGNRRIEGYPVNVAKQVERASRQGKYSRIMVSQSVHDLIRSSTIKHTQLKQRVFFHDHPEKLEPLVGVSRGIKLFELKFVHRIGIPVSTEMIEQYDALFKLDRANIWAYYQLAEYFAFEAKDWQQLFSLAKAANLAHPKDEKVLLDLAKYFLEVGKPDQSMEFAKQALALNESFDLIHEHLAVIATKKDLLEEQICHFRTAVRLTPGSAVNNFNLGLALLQVDEMEEGFYFIEEALRIYPEYKDWQVFRETLLSLRNEGKLPSLLREFLEIDKKPNNPKNNPG